MQKNTKDYRQKQSALQKKKEKVFRNNPFDSHLKTHKLSGHLQDFWSFSIDRKNRIIFEFLDEKTISFHSVGSRQIYR